MNSGLPSLLDAIFGKKDLASVSLFEMYEVINEFPSFNAGHFLLSKKLKEQNDPAFEKQSKRTALYFNNAFWLQTLLDEGWNIRTGEFTSTVRTEAEELAYDNDSYVAEPIVPTEDERDEEITESSNIEITALANDTGNFLQNLETFSGRVSSFDELLSKYKIVPEVPAEDSLQVNIEKVTDEEIAETTEHIVPHIAEPEPVLEFLPDLPIESEPDIAPYFSFETIFESQTVSPADEIIPVSSADQFEIREEVLNEYGIFEEVIVKKPDLDLEAFDRPIDQVPATPELLSEKNQPEENGTMIENQDRSVSPEITDKHDYEAFDRPLDKSEQTEYPSGDELDEEIEEVLDEKIAEVPDFSSIEPDIESDDTEQTILFAGESEEEMNGQMQELADRFNEQRKSLPVFDPKKAESIVFAPYHMIDYFASQGIKLVLEDNPPDHLGKQLKSFTDWLKVMKKLPVHQQPGSTDERESDRIRHFAAHSIVERDVLTESMAEVLAKQGMHENAIALYQKLSLIYPPKSAYFASRIDQLKAFLP